VEDKVMIFLIEYDRREGRIVRQMKEFQDSEWQKAADERLEIELDLSRKGVDREVVLLEAASETALRRTHRRYFESLSEIGSTTPPGP
jgi:hypothetical protein